ncbi:MAG: signal peptidase I [Lachnospiraceae bacterium]
MILPSEERVKAERRRLKQKAAYRRAFRGTINTLLIVAAIAVLISSLILPVMQVSGDSMAPVLKNGDIIVLIKTKDFRAGDLISFTWNNKTLLKRVIAGAGDWITIDGEGRVFVNGNLLEEPYVNEPGLGENDVEYPYQIPENSYWVMGDKRVSSIDSRSSLIGCVNHDQIIGKVLFRIWPLKGLGALEKRWA